jgi:acetyl/propionyl-CoA carboxylase alpha subunit
MRLDGVRSNAPVLRALLAHPDVLANRLHTRFVDEHLAEARGTQSLDVRQAARRDERDVVEVEARGFEGLAFLGRAHTGCVAPAAPLARRQVRVPIDDANTVYRLGRSDGRFTEVLAGLQAGDRYVVENSYLIKADIEKSGASHDH